MVWVIRRGFMVKELGGKEGGREAEGEDEDEEKRGGRGV